MNPVTHENSFAAEFGGAVRTFLANAPYLGLQSEPDGGEMSWTLLDRSFDSFSY